LNIYASTGTTLLATVQGSGATCAAGGATFDIPASVAENQTSVQIAYENLTTKRVSAKLKVNLVGMVPTITGTGLGCTNDTCVWITATDTAYHDCSVGIYDPTSYAQIASLSGSQVNCTSTEVTFVIPASIKSYKSVLVHYMNLAQGTWSKLASVTLPVTAGSGGGGKGGGNGCTGPNCAPP
jgi:hypothetical protein